MFKFFDKYPELFFASLYFAFMAMLFVMFGYLAYQESIEKIKLEELKAKAACVQSKK